MGGLPFVRAYRDRRRAYELWITCADCGDVVIPAEECDLQVMHDRRHSVAYPCPSCGRRDVFTVSASLAEVLRAVGFIAHRASAPRELLEPRPLGPPFTWDDLLSFHEQLARDEIPLG
jgi:predicted RNA-binding Zn-ribbon protein involved in translation (DUF1610 family)